ncbi:MAG: hypothetical protein EOP84_15460 [Verrucomicrobiaceae bacterium]|nr:MAG: hypothetical protein EOP84_15460 [Verrucomicrobiaceae bacterium]
MTAAAHYFAYYLDRIIEQAAKLLSRISPLADAGFFYEPQLSSFWDAWTENGNTLTVRMGRFEFSASMKRAA